jgi:hypothetical protein
MPENEKNKNGRTLPIPEELEPGMPNAPSNHEKDESEEKKNTGHRGVRNFVPIILSLLLTLIFVPGRLSAQIEAAVTMQTAYSDNVFQLSEYDLDRFNDDHPNLDYVNTTDDLNLSARFDLAYPIRYKWYKFTPSLTGTLSQCVSNPEKYRRDGLFRLRVDRYYWNATVLYGYYPHLYVREYVDTDGSGELEPYSYQKNLYRGDVQVKPVKHATLKLNARYEQLFYNQYFTQYDGNAVTYGLGLRYSFPLFVLDADYRFRTFDNVNAGDRDASYESNQYLGSLRLKPMPLSDKHSKGAAWYPTLSLGLEQRYFQSDDSWYGGRADYVYTTTGELDFVLDRHWNIKLDYTHTFRNVESPVSEVRRLREYSENSLSAAVKYSF